MSKNLSALASKAPNAPGVYKFLNEDGDVIYVGKAKTLKKRLQSYFRGKDQSPKTLKMLEKAKGLEWTETNTEVEALILEDNLVKELQPKYNILLKDDKNFQYIKVTVNRDYPEVLSVRKLEKDGARYFGPKTSGTDARNLIETAKRIFRLCSVHGIRLDPEGTPLPGAKVAVKIGTVPAKRPCLDYHIHRCLGPCAGMITPQEYKAVIAEALDFLSGNFKPALTSLKKQMTELALQKKFEQAAKLRDVIASIERSAEKQIIRDTRFSDRDIIAYVEDLGKNFFNVFQIRSGRLIGQEHFISEGGEAPADVMEAFVREYYGLAADIPKEVIISVQVEDAALLEEFIRRQADKAVRLIHPEKGLKDDLVMLAETNARSYAKQCRARWMTEGRDPEKGLSELQKALNLKDPPKRMECYDISHLSGTETVGSMVVMKKGIEHKADYRLFRLKTTQGTIDDFKSIAEVLRRRLNYLPARLPEGYKIKKERKTDFHVIEKGKEVVGKIRCRLLEKNVPLLDELWVKDEERGKKLGHFLLRAAIEKCKENRLYIVCKSELEEYYASYGFETLRESPAVLKTLHQGPRVFMAYQKKKKDTSFETRPDLIVIDGGKGQLSAAHGVLAEKGLESIPMIALAKRLEEVFVPGKPDPVNLPNNSEAGYLLQRLRDEAHRFAIESNRSARLKSMTKSALDDIPGVGPKLKKRLLSHFGSPEAIRKASQAELSAITGPALAQKILSGF